MPDQYGRIGPSDIRGLQSQFIQASEFKQKQSDEAEARMTNKKHDEYLDRLSQGEDLDRIRSTDSEFSAKAAMAASATWTIQQKRSAELTEAVKQSKMSDIMVEYAEANQMGKQAVSLMQSGDAKGALDIYAEIFNTKFKDGRTATITEQDGVPGLQIIGRDGKRIAVEFMDATQTAEAAGTLIGEPGKGGRENFVKAYLKAEQDYEQAVAVASYKPTELKATPEGETILRYDYPAKTGKKRKVEYFDSKGEMFDPETVKDMQLKPISYWRAEELHQAKLRESRAKAKGLGITKVRVKGIIEKTAEGYMAAYEISKDEATDMVREDNARGNIADKVAEYSAKNFLDHGDKDDMKDLKRYRETLIKEYAPVAPSTRGLNGDKDKKKVKGTPAQLKKLQAADLIKRRGLPDGTKAYAGAYIVKNGKWIINK